MTLHQLLEITYLMGGFTTRCNLARENAELVAEASQRGFITTLTPSDGYMNVWRLTSDGLNSLEPFKEPTDYE